MLQLETSIMTCALKIISNNNSSAVSNNKKSLFSFLISQSTFSHSIKLFSSFFPVKTSSTRGWKQERATLGKKLNYARTRKQNKIELYCCKKNWNVRMGKKLNYFCFNLHLRQSSCWISPIAVCQFNRMYMCPTSESAKINFRNWNINLIAECERKRENIKGWNLSFLN